MDHNGHITVACMSDHAHSIPKLGWRDKGTNRSQTFWVKSL